MACCKNLELHLETAAALAQGGSWLDLTSRSDMWSLPPKVMPVVNQVRSMFTDNILYIRPLKARGLKKKGGTSSGGMTIKEIQVT
jgi:hypothetical protein